MESILAAEFTVTDGSVEYKHTKPLAEYDNKTPMVRLTFTIAEGSDPLAAAEKVMGMAMLVVEKAIATNVTITQEPPKPVKATKVNSLIAPAADAEPINSASGASTTDAAAITDETPEPVPEPEPEKKKLTLKDDVQPLAQKVSAKLRKEFGNIGALRDVFEACGSPGKNLTGMPEDQWRKFMTEAEKLLSE